MYVLVVVDSISTRRKHGTNVKGLHAVSNALVVLDLIVKNVQYPGWFCNARRVIKLLVLIAILLKFVLNALTSVA